MMYGKTVVRRVCVTNMGTVPVQVIFQKKVPDDESCDICAPWLIVRPLKATISPRERGILIQLGWCWCTGEGLGGGAGVLGRVLGVVLVYWGGFWGWCWCTGEDLGGVLVFFLILQPSILYNIT